MSKGGNTEHEQSNIDLVDFDKDGDTFVDLA
jgi:hypothetical protein